MDKQMSFLHVITQGASLVAKFLPVIIGALAAEDSKKASKKLQAPDNFSTDFGDIKWAYNKDKNQVVVANIGNTEKGIHFSRTDKDTGIYTELYHPLGPLELFNATQHLSDYADGNIAMSQAEIASDSSVGAGLPANLNRFFAYIPHMADSQIRLSVEISIDKTDKGFVIKMSSVFNNARLSLTDKQGQSFTLTAEAQKGKDRNEKENENYQCLLELPSAADPNFPFSSLGLEILMPADTYKAITAERRQKNVKIDKSVVPFMSYLIA